MHDWMAASGAKDAKERVMRSKLREKKGLVVRTVTGYEIYRKGSVCDHRQLVRRVQSGGVMVADEAGTQGLLGRTADALASGLMGEGDGGRKTGTWLDFPLGVRGIVGGPLHLECEVDCKVYTSIWSVAVPDMQPPSPPAEWISPENGWRTSATPIRDQQGKCEALLCRRA